MKNKFSTPSEALAQLRTAHDQESQPSHSKIHIIEESLESLSNMEILQIANSCMIKLQTEQRDRFIIEAISDLKLPEQFSLVDKIFNSMAEDQGTFQCNDFVSKSLIAMRHLQRNNKCNIMYGLAKDLGTFRSNGESLLNVHKMPFGLLAYNIMFFSAEHVYQV